MGALFVVRKRDVSRTLTVSGAVRSVGVVAEVWR